MNTLLDYPSLSDRQLIALHLDGDRDAFRQIVERYQGMVCALGLSACSDVARSEDIAQEVFIAAWKQLPDLREPEKLRSWIGGIARNMINSAFCRQQRSPTERSEPLSPETPAAGESPRDQAVSADETALMWSMLAGIPETYREPMVLFYREQQSVPAVAATLEISEDLVRQRLVRGRAMLTERMAKLVEESLGRSAPTPAYAGAVMLMLPFGVAPAVIVAEAGAVGGKAAAGGTATTAAGTAGAIGLGAAKGGMFVKVVSLLALLPALLGGFEDFMRFRGRHEAVADHRERRRVAWAYFLMQAGFGAAILGFFVVPNLVFGKNTPVAAYVLLGLGIIAALWTFLLAKRRVDRNMDANLPRVASCSEVWKPRLGGHFEWRSERTFLGLPLWHVRLGSKCGWRRPVVKAWIAISDGRAIGGLFALGNAAIAPISMGIGAFGWLLRSGRVLHGRYWRPRGGRRAGWLNAGVVAVGGHAVTGIWVAPQWASWRRVNSPWLRMRQ